MPDELRRIYAFVDFELDEGLRELRHRGRPVGLRRRPLELLLYVVRHRDRVVSKRELLDALWPGVSVSEGALTSAMRDVRRALRESGRGAGLVRTHHGFGYRFAGAVTERPRAGALAPLPQPQAGSAPPRAEAVAAPPGVDPAWAARFSRRLLRFVLQELAEPAESSHEPRTTRLAG